MRILNKNVRCVTYSPAFIRAGIPLNAAIMLTKAIQLSEEKAGEYGWFYYRLSDWCKDLGIRRRMLDTARKNLREAGVLEERIDRVWLTYRVNFERLDELLTKAIKAA